MAEQGTAADLRSALVRDKLDWLELRLDRLEHPKDEPKPRASPLTFLVAGIDKIAAWLPAVTPIVLFVLGTWFVNAAGDVVENQRVALENQRLALQERQVELGGIAEMREIVAELYEDGITSTEAEATALSLAAFGALAAPPLIHAIETGDAVRMTGAETGLAAAALADPRGVCRILAGVIANRTALYSWQTQQSAVKLLGRLGCRDQRLSVEAFGRLLGRRVCRLPGHGKAGDGDPRGERCQAASPSGTAAAGAGAARHGREARDARGGRPGFARPRSC